MIPPIYTITGLRDPLAAQLSAALAAGPPPALPVLVNTDAAQAEILAHTRDFAAAIPAGQEGLVITLLHAHPPGLNHFDDHAANATLWAFTQQAARAWAPRRIRINAIGLGVSPSDPFEPVEQAGRAAVPMQAAPATLEDIARTICFIAACPSLTGQIIRLGA